MHSGRRLIATVRMTILGTTIFLLANVAGAAGVDPVPVLDPAGIQDLVSATGGTAQVSVSKATGAARFVRVAPKSLPLMMPQQAPTEARAREFFMRYGGIFGITDVDGDLKAVAAKRDAFGGEHLTFVQSYRGVPVFGGELRVHFDRHGDLSAVNGTFVPKIKLDLDPIVSSDMAAQKAVTTVTDQQDNRTTTKQRGDLREQEMLGGKRAVVKLAVASSTLYVFRSGLVQGVAGTDHLVYEVEVVNPARTVREFVYVDAHSGKVIDQITGIHEALDRKVSETNLGNVIWEDSAGDPDPISSGWAGGTAQQVTDWNNEIDGTKETYNVFASMTSGAWLSYDGVDAIMRTVNNDPGIACPNANWNGTSTNYCSGVTGDDTVAHEWGHAYTDYTSNLIYQWQSGALNESYSDIWGEVVDLLNGRGSDFPGTLRTAGGCSIFGVGAPSVDNSYRWLSGEDDPAFGGAIRDLWTPTCYGDPGKVTDGQYFCSTADSGGVHSNSGVPNHAFALMVDGGTYNGQTITGIGLTKAAHIHWGALNMLSLASNFSDQANALAAACSSLVGVNLPALSTSVTNAGPSGEFITAGDCAEVAKVNLAVEFSTEPTQCGFSTLLDPDAPALCEGLGSTMPFAGEDWEGGSLPAGWTVGSRDVANPPTFDTPDWSVVGSLPSGANGNYAAFVPDLSIGDCGADDESGVLYLDSPPMVVPAGIVPHLAFDHWVATEGGWDGGNVKVSVNGGPWTHVPASSYDFNAYNAALNSPPGNTNPMAGEDAFTGTDGGSAGGSWGQSQVSLAGLAFPGDSVRVRFDFGIDGCNGVFGWYVDDVELYSCSAELPPVCGDGILDFGEACDDGNAANGDGCSSTCQVEDGWACADPIPPSSGSNIMADGGFEAGAFGGVWAESSTNYGTPVCSVGSCGTGTGTGPADGMYWTWFGGVAAYEEGSVSQSVTIPSASTNITFDLEQIICDSATDYVELTVDGAQVFQSDGTSSLCGTLGYSTQTVDLSAYADGGNHLVEFHSEIFANNGGGSNFFVDNVYLSDNQLGAGTPSVCLAFVDEVACNEGIVGFKGGIPGSWQVVDNTGTGMVWMDIAGSGESGNYTGGSDDAATASSDRFGLADFDTGLRSNVFSLANASSATLDYVTNYQNFAAFDFLDVDISTDGGSSWTNLLSWNEDHGGFRSTPGEPVSIDLGAYVGMNNVQLRWRYYDPTTFDWDWYAQVDDVSLTCNLNPDCASAAASVEMLWSPNHKFKAIDVLVTDPDGDPVTVTIDSIYQDEKVKGPGKHHPDGQGVGTSTAEVRAERDGKGDGRVYHIYFTADDGRGGSCSGEVTVGVPHDKGGGSVPVDGGPLYDSTTP